MFVQEFGSFFFFRFFSFFFFFFFSDVYYEVLRVFILSRI